MKRALAVLVLALLAGLAAFCLMRSYKQAEHSAVVIDGFPELGWLRTDLNLTEAQYAEVSRLHAAYRPRCEEMCREIAVAREELEQAAIKDRTMSPGLQEAIRRHADTRAKCRQAMLSHMYETAAVLDEKQAARYLETMLPFAMDEAAAGGEPHASP